jgi:cellulose synthase (UDP-forming)
MYAATFYSYLSPLWNIIFLVSPIIFLFSGGPPLAGYALDFFVHISPFLLMNELSQLVGCGAIHREGEGLVPRHVPAQPQALWTVARGKKISFPVTPKDRQVGTFPRLVRWQIALVVFTLAGLIWGWSAYAADRPGYTLGAMIANTLWGLSNALP